MNSNHQDPFRIWGSDKRSVFLVILAYLSNVVKETSVFPKSHKKERRKKGRREKENSLKLTMELIIDDYR